jgi:cytoskeleton protein RodZ
MRKGNEASMVNKDVSEKAATEKQNTIGEMLKKAREVKKVTLEEAAAETSIRKLYLQAVETDDFTQIPGDVYVKGILRTYGNYLGLDGAALVEEYKIRAKGMAPEAAVSESIRVVDEVKVSPTFKPNNEEEFSQNKSTVFTALFVLILLLIAAGGYYFFFMNNGNSSNVKANVPSGQTSSVNPVKPAPAKPAVPPAVKPQTPKPAATEPVVKGQVNISLKCNGNCWIQVNEGNKELFQGNLNKNEVQKFTSKSGLTIVYGNIKDMDITVNGQPLPVDKSEQVVTKQYNELAK